MAGLKPRIFPGSSIRFASPQRLLAGDRLMALAVSLGMAGAHGGMPDITLEWARRTRELKETLGVYLEIQTFLPKPGEDSAVRPKIEVREGKP